jgi:hypothetical protein
LLVVLPAAADTHFAPCLTPHGRLVLVAQEDAPALDAALAERLLLAFGRGPGHGLLRLGAAEMGQALPPALGYWRDFAARFVAGICTQPESAERHTQVPAPAAGELAELALCGPTMAGAEYLTPAVLSTLWGDIANAFTVELKQSGAAVQDFLKQLNPAWNLVGRVHFNLAENRKDPDAPFAFLATYTSRLSSHGKAQHLPLGQALREYAGTSSKQRLLSLLLPVQRAAETCAWLRQMVDAGEIFHPLRWTPDEAFRLLGDAAALESAGVVLRMPAGWKANRPPRPQVTAIVGGKPAVGVGKDALLDFRMQVTLDGEALTEAELHQLLDATGGLAMVRGRWVEIDRERLEAMMQQYRKAEQLAAEGGMTFAEAMRLLSGAGTADEDVVRLVASRGRTVAGRTAQGTAPARVPGLRRARPRSARNPAPVSASRRALATPPVETGSGRLPRRRHGPGQDHPGTRRCCWCCKTERTDPQRPSLLVAPASLLANWAAEIERFAPGLKALIAHPSAMPADELKALPAERLASRSRDHELRLALASAVARDGTRWHLVVSTRPRPSRTRAPSRPVRPRSVGLRARSR